MEVVHSLLMIVLEIKYLRLSDFYLLKVKINVCLSFNHDNLIPAYCLYTDCGGTPLRF